MNKTKHYLLWRDAFLCTCLTGTVALVFYLLFVNVSFLDPFEQAFEDFSFNDLYYSEGFYDQVTSKEIVLVNVKQAGRFEIAQALQHIAEAQPRAIGIDLLFKELKEPYSDSLLREALSHPRVVAAFYWEDTAAVASHPYFRERFAHEGFVNLDQPDGGRVIREFLGVKANGDTSVSLGVRLAGLAGKEPDPGTLERLSRSQPIDYRIPSQGFLTLDIDDVLQSESLPVVKDAIVIFGYLGTPTGNANDIEDKHFTPMNTSIAGRSVPDMYGVEIHGNIAYMLLHSRFVMGIPDGLVYLAAFLFCLLVVKGGMQLYVRNEFAFDILAKIIQLSLSVILVYFALLLLKSGIYVRVTPVLIWVLLGLEMIGYYEYLVVYLQKRFAWKSYLLD